MAPKTLKSINKVKQLLALKEEGVVFAISDQEVFDRYVNFNSNMLVICSACEEQRETSVRHLMTCRWGSMCRSCAYELGLYRKKDKKQKFNSVSEKLKAHKKTFTLFTVLLCKKWNSDLLLSC